MADRAVSEVLGFILVFSLVVLTVSFVYMGGMSQLTDTRDTERINNAERAFDVLADNFEQMGRNEAPSRATEIRLAGAQLSTSGNQPFSANRTQSEAGTTRLNPVVISFSIGGSEQISYELGAIIRVHDEGGGVMVREPDFIFSEHRTVLRVIEPRGSNQAIGGTRTVLVRGELVSASVQDSGEGDAVEIQLETTAQRAEIWLSYFESELQWETDPCEIEPLESEDQSMVTCTFATEYISIAETRVQIELT